MVRNQRISSAGAIVVIGLEEAYTGIPEVLRNDMVTSSILIIRTTEGLTSTCPEIHTASPVIFVTLTLEDGIASVSSFRKSGGILGRTGHGRGVIVVTGVSGAGA